jgi:hypothetical protein
MTPSQGKVAISPSALSIEPGATLNLSSVVTATFDGDDVSGDLSYALTSAGHASGTALSGTGANTTLTIDSAESIGSTITIRVSHPGANGNSATGDYKDITVTVIPPSILPKDATTFTDTVTGGTVVWKVLKDNRPTAGTSTTNAFGKTDTSTGDGTVLMITEKVYGTGGLTSLGTGYTYHSTGSWVQYENANIKGAFDKWYAANTSVALKDEAYVPSLTYEHPTSPDPAFSGILGISDMIQVTGARNLPAAYSSASATKADTTTSGVVFPLSFSEVNQYFKDVNAKKGYAISGTVQRWWLRSPDGYNNDPRGSDVYTDGNMYVAPVGMLLGGLRPALWIDTTQ